MTVTGDRVTGVWQASASTYIGLAAPVTMATGWAAMASALNRRMQAGLGTTRFRDRRPPSRR